MGLILFGTALFAPFVLAWLSARSDRPGLAVMLGICGIAGLVALVSVMWVFGECFTIFEPEPTGCEERESRVKLILAAWGITVAASVVVAMWSFKGPLAAGGVIGLGALTLALMQVPRLFEPDQIDAQGRIVFTSCARGEDGARLPCGQYEVDAGGAGKAVYVAAGSLTGYRSATDSSVSPDGTLTAQIVRNENAYEDGFGLWSLLVTDGGPPRLLLKDVELSSLVWSPGGHYLLVFQDSGYRLTVVNVRKGTSWKVAGSTAEFVEPIWSPDGRHVAYVERAHSRNCTDLHVVQRDGSHDRRLTKMRDCSIVGPLEWVADAPGNAETPATSRATPVGALPHTATLVTRMRATRRR